MYFIPRLWSIQAFIIKIGFILTHSNWKLYNNIMFLVVYFFFLQVINQLDYFTSAVIGRFVRFISIIILLILKLKLLHHIQQQWTKIVQSEWFQLSTIQMDMYKYLLGNLGIYLGNLEIAQPLVPSRILEPSFPLHWKYKQYNNICVYLPFHNP